MPIYEYQCRKCGKYTEALRGLDDRAEAPACDWCGHPETEPVLSPTPGVVTAPAVPKRGR